MTLLTNQSFNSESNFLRLDTERISTPKEFYENNFDDEINKSKNINQFFINNDIFIENNDFQKKKIYEQKSNNNSLTSGRINTSSTNGLFTKSSIGDNSRKSTGNNIGNLSKNLLSPPRIKNNKIKLNGINLSSKNGKNLGLKANDNKSLFDSSHSKKILNKYNHSEKSKSKYYTNKSSNNLINFDLNRPINILDTKKSSIVRKRKISDLVCIKMPQIAEVKENKSSNISVKSEYEKNVQSDEINHKNIINVLENIYGPNGEDYDKSKLNCKDSSKN